MKCILNYITTKSELGIIRSIERELIAHSPDNYHPGPMSADYVSHIFGMDSFALIKNEFGADIGYATVDPPSGIFKIRVLPQFTEYYGTAIRAVEEFMASPAFSTEVNPGDNALEEALTKSGYKKRYESGWLAVRTGTGLAPKTEKAHPETMRLATPADAAAIISLNETENSMRDTEIYRNYMLSPGFAESSYEPIAFVNGSPAAHVLFLFDKQSSSAMLEYVYCAEEFRRLGITKRLICAGLTHIDKLSITRCYVQTEADNAAAISLYEKCGFAGKPASLYIKNGGKT